MQLWLTLKVLYKDKLAAWLINIAALFVLGTWIWLLSHGLDHQNLTVLHYNIYSGIDVLGEWYWIYILPGIVLLFSGLNIWLGLIFWKNFPVLSYFFLSTVLLVNIFLFIYVFNILGYNLR